MDDGDDDEEGEGAGIVQVTFGLWLSTYYIYYWLVIMIELCQT